jgi:two-component system osmolarity sensor histidine kinase EnvZ
MLKQLLPRTLFGRSLLIIVTPLLLVQIITSYTFYDRHWDVVTRRLTSALAGDIAMIVHSLQQSPSEDDRRQIFLNAFYDMDIRASLKTGETLSKSAGPGILNILDRYLTNALNERVGLPFRIDTHSRERQIIINVQLSGGVLTVSTPRERLFNSSSYIFLLWMFGSSLLLFAVALVFMRNQIRPIRKLAAAADSFGKGRTVEDFKPAGAIEVRQAATAFNMMRERIRRQISQRTKLLAGVSHDLRTPLTRMKLQLALLKSDEATAELRSDVEEMERMIDGYLAFARGEGSETTATTNLSVLLAEVVNGARREGGTVQLQAEDDLWTQLRPDSFRRALNNLVANATRFGNCVVVQAKCRNNMIEITVDDDGPGIPENKREEVFNPFYRLDGSRNPATGGVGLGLTIARDVIRGHGGDIQLADSPNQGLRVRILLPM